MYGHGVTYNGWNYIISYDTKQMYKNIPEIQFFTFPIDLLIGNELLMLSHLTWIISNTQYRSLSLNLTLK